MSSFASAWAALKAKTPRSTDARRSRRKLSLISNSLAGVVARRWRQPTLRRDVPSKASARRAAGLRDWGSGGWREPTLRRDVPDKASARRAAGLRDWGSRRWREPTLRRDVPNKASARRAAGLRDWGFEVLPRRACWRIKRPCRI